LAVFFAAFFLVTVFFLGDRLAVFFAAFFLGDRLAVFLVVRFAAFFFAAMSWWLLP